MSEYRKCSDVVHRLRFHVGFITRHRKTVLRGNIAQEVRRLTREICPTHAIEIINGHVRPDHAHLLWDVPLRISASDVMKFIKRKTSHHLLQDSRRFRKEFCGRHLWARGCFAAGTGNVNEEIVAEYIKNQDVESQDSDDFKVTE